MELERREREELRGLFNAVWSAVPDGPAYDGKKWRRLAALVDKAAKEAGMETPIADDRLAELESRAEGANALLRAVLPIVQADAFPYPDVRNAVEEAARLTYWKRHPLPDDGEWMDRASARADELARKNGSPYLVLFNESKRQDVVCMPVASFEKWGAFSYDKRDIVYVTGRGLELKG